MTFPIYWIVLLLILTGLSCEESSNSNHSKNGNLAKIDEQYLKENNYLNRITAEEYFGKFELEFFMYEGSLNLLPNRDFELSEFTDIQESVSYGKWDFSKDTVIIYTDSIKYLPKENIVKDTSKKNTMLIDDTGTIYHFPGITDKIGTKKTKDTLRFKYKENKLVRLSSEGELTSAQFERIKTKNID